MYLSQNTEPFYSLVYFVEVIEKRSCGIQVSGNFIWAASHGDPINNLFFKNCRYFSILVTRVGKNHLTSPKLSEKALPPIPPTDNYTTRPKQGYFKFHSSIQISNTSHKLFFRTGLEFIPFFTMSVKSWPQKEVKKQKLDERVMNQGTTMMEDFKTAT